jgi:hypothetical protein
MEAQENWNTLRAALGAGTAAVTIIERAWWGGMPIIHSIHVHFQAANRQLKQKRTPSSSRRCHTQVLFLVSNTFLDFVCIPAGHCAAKHDYTPAMDSEPGSK